MALQADTTETTAASLLRRLWQYQRERFPIAAHGVAMTAFALAAVGVSAAAAPHPRRPDAGAVVAALIGVFGFFLLLRIADEFKDREADARHRAHRPVPRGLVSLRELAGVGAAAAAGQLAAALWLHPPLSALLAAVWGYFGLMSAEFFAPRWLRRHPAVYLVSHIAILPLIALYASACHWLTAGEPPHAGALAALALLALGNGLVFEIGRKIRTPADERPGIETYSGLWGPRAAAVWLAAVSLASLGALAAGAASSARLPGIAALLAAVAGAAVAANYLRRPTAGRAKAFEVSAQAIVLLLLFAVGLPPLGGPS